MSFRLARISPRTCNTGPSAHGCNITIDAGDFGGNFTVSATITSGPQSGQTFIVQPGWVIGAYGGSDLAQFEWYGVSGTYAHIGQTATHPDNHYCLGGVCQQFAQLAVDYNAQWSLILAYNDMSLRKGGIFDVNANWSTPHSEHRAGRNVDVRANGAANSIPFDPAIRQWFVSRVIEIFGQQPLHESQGTSNEHYHVRG